MKIHKNIIIGAGPIGCFVFNQLNKNSILITGKTNKVINSKKLHPKIRIKLNKITNKFSDLIFSKKNNFYIYSSSQIGGFSNYWGRQFFNYQKNEYWPKEIFKKYSIYKKNIDEIDKIYFSPKHEIIKNINNGDLTFKQIKAPILRTSIINKKIIRKKSKIIEDRVISFNKIGKNLIEVITENNTMYCHNLILCAGPIGNASILMRSYKKINYSIFKDDNPRMIFGLKMKKKEKLNNVKENVVDLDIIKNGNLVNFCIIYKVNPLHFNSFFRVVVIFFRNFLNKFFFYGQYWVTDEYNEIKINNIGKNNLLAVTKNLNNSNIKVVKNLQKIGLMVIKVLKLKFAYGFHYHCLKINYAGKLFSLNQFIDNQKLKNNVYCVDSSIIEKIGLKPPTKTYLATANFLLKKFKNKFK